MFSRPVNSGWKPDGVAGETERYSTPLALAEIFGLRLLPGLKSQYIMLSIVRAANNFSAAKQSRAPITVASAP